MTNPPEWAIEIAFDASSSDDPEERGLETARALAATAARVERETIERCCLWQKNEAIDIDQSSRRINGKAKTQKPRWHTQSAATLRALPRHYKVIDND